MAADYHINVDEGLIAIRIQGQVDLVELLQQSKKLLADPQFDPLLPQLVDLRDIRLQLENSATKPFSRFITKKYGPRIEASIAVVVDPDLDADLCAGIYWLCCTVEHTEMFECYDHALKWLMKREFANNTLKQPDALAKQPDAHANHAHRSPE